MEYIIPFLVPFVKPYLFGRFPRLKEWINNEQHKGRERTMSDGDVFEMVLRDGYKENVFRRF